MPGRWEFCGDGGGALTGAQHFPDRFTGRVESYRQFRPRYPSTVVALLEAECGLTPTSTIADIAAGTGLLAEIFLARGFEVTAVEPNEEMRTACGSLIERYLRLHCVDGSAEATGLPSDAFDLITVGQALHWFDLERARAEFSRILRTDGWCAVIYNERRLGGDGFHDGYERLLREFGIDYEVVRRQHLTPDQIDGFFSSSPVKRVVFPNAQLFTVEALTGRIVSSSYMPRPGHARYATMLDAIAHLFETYQENGLVRLEYTCAVSYGRLE
ncbi:MAG TPA: methyltransferase domain-containing protein [Alloacidobacterium sp.]|nr:methyltransferase domain-containing protein [Alloacidobacterium sp.]